ncbi:MAG: hypothetical protein NC390_00940 [Fusobacterium sp.]|nr:hypothetical protein [Fusobacterium sp.]
MNVSSSTATTSTTSTTSTSTATKTQEKSSASFDEEMKKADSTETAEQEVQQNPEEAKAQEKEDGAAGEKQNQQNASDNLLGENSDTEIDVKLNTADLLSLNIQQLLDTQNQINSKTDVFQVSISRNEDLTKSIGETISLEMNEGDAQFFIDVVKNNNAGVQNVVQDVQQAMTFGTEKVQKSANVSQTLINALHNSVKTGQAVRIDFGNDVAVVMRVNRDGSIMANFIPGDKAVEEYLKNNIGFLKQRFDEEDIPYSQLSYSQHQQQERRQQQENNKENKHE